MITRIADNIGWQHRRSSHPRSVALLRCGQHPSTLQPFVLGLLSINSLLPEKRRGGTLLDPQVAFSCLHGPAPFSLPPSVTSAVCLRRSVLAVGGNKDDNNIDVVKK